MKNFPAQMSSRRSLQACSMSLLVAFSLFSSDVTATEFNVAEMPEGAEVTVPQAATTVIPVQSRIVIGSTDQPQTIRIVPTKGISNGRPMSLVIEDSNKVVKKVQVHSGSPFLYSFKGLSSVTITSDDPSTPKGLKSSAKLNIESDKPLTVKVLKF